MDQHSKPGLRAERNRNSDPWTVQHRPYFNQPGLRYPYWNLYIRAWRIRTRQPHLRQRRLLPDSRPCLRCHPLPQPRSLPHHPRRPHPERRLCGNLSRQSQMQGLRMAIRSWPIAPTNVVSSTSSGVRRMLLTSAQVFRRMLVTSAQAPRRTIDLAPGESPVLLSPTTLSASTAPQTRQPKAVFAEEGLSSHVPSPFSHSLFSSVGAVCSALVSATDTRAAGPFRLPTCSPRTTASSTRSLLIMFPRRVVANISRI